MRPLIIELEDNSQPHWVYDLSLPLEERAENKLYFKTAAEAANYIGVPPKKIWDHRQPGTTLYSPIHNKRFAVRIATQKQKTYAKSSSIRIKTS